MKITVIIDVDYRENNTAVASAIVFNDYTSDSILNSYSLNINDVLPYESGKFYKRELPCILKLLNIIKEDIELIIIDGYAHLDIDKKEGIGVHLLNSISDKLPIIGIAKNQFKNTDEKHNVFRGDSKKPLYITSINYDLEKAKHIVSSMHGSNRLPTLAKLVDFTCRNTMIN
jgi:deoxyribonuclease V